MSRLQNYINESYNATELLPYLKKDCKPFLKELKKSSPIKFFYRGNRKKNSSGILKIQSRLDRKPLDTPELVHNMLNKEFNNKFGWDVRNGIFATSDVAYAGGYGESSLFFPIGKYEYVWSPVIKDMYDYIGAGDSNYLSEITDVLYGEYSNYFIGRLKKMFVRGTSYDGPTSKNIITFEEYKKDYFKKMLDDFDNTIKKAVGTYQSTNMKASLQKGNEVTFRCKEYYLIDNYYEDKLIELI